MLSLMLLLNFILPFLNHPLLVTILSVIQSLLICLLMSLINSSCWFSYILFLSFLGGMLVLFIYMTTLTSNELMKFPLKSFMTSMTLTSLIITYFSSNFNPIFIFFPNLKNNFLLNLNQLFTFPNIMLTIMMISYLLIFLIAMILCKVGIKVRDEPCIFTITSFANNMVCWVFALVLLSWNNNVIIYPIYLQTTFFENFANLDFDWMNLEWI